MLAFLLVQLAGILDLREFVLRLNPPQEKLKKLIMAAKDDQLEPLWKSGTGLCTS
jgi:hypothetical protein